MYYLRFPIVAGGLLLVSISMCAVAATLPIYDQRGNLLSDAVVKVDDVVQRPVVLPLIDQMDRQFQPSVLVVPTGTDVEFSNSDDVRHHVYSFSATKSFDLPLLESTGSRSVTFDQSGLVVLGCNIHDTMIGYILVTDSPWYAISDADGSLDLNHLSPGEMPVSWWHPSLGDSAPVSLGNIDLHALQRLDLAVGELAEVAADKSLSTLQMRFNKAAEKHAD
jgi:plastocyanin